VRPTTLEDQVPVLMSLSDRVGRSYLQAPGSSFVAFNDSEGYAGGILTRLHGRAIPQAVSRRIPTAAARVQNRVWSCGIL
jgi:hypothetical protein